MILTGPEIEGRIRAGTIRIDPFDPSHVNPASVDLHLGGRYFRYAESPCLDPFSDNPGDSWPIGDEGIFLIPGTLYLMHTAERVWAADLVPVLDGKSTIGRLGVSVHQTAGYGDPGFDGQYTLEVTSVRRVRLKAGMPIAQIRFHETRGVIRSYQQVGRYTREHASGPVPARPFR